MQIPADLHKLLMDEAQERRITVKEIIEGALLWALKERIKRQKEKMVEAAGVVVESPSPPP